MLRTQEDKKFVRFMELVEAEARKRGCEFFLDCVQGDEFENDTYICEDMCGWLIPESMVDKFTPIFMADSDSQYDFDDFYVFVDYRVHDDNIEIEIDDTPNDLIVELNIKDEVVKKI